MSESSKVDANLLAQKISSNIQRITLLTNEIQQMINHLGTERDTNELRQILLQKQQNVNHLAKATDKCMKEFNSLPVTTEQRQKKIQRERLITEFSNCLGIFQRTQRDAARKEKEFVARVRASSRVSAGGPDDQFGGTTSQFGSEIQTQTQGLVEITEEDLQLIQERESSIKQLESDITDINTIFKDLAVLVHEQGDMIDSIEANVESTEVNVQSATQQLSSAADYQKSSRKKICIIIAVLIVLGIIIGLIIWASVKS
ncbi:syntaxin-7 [Triplophysa dalaica]|uniref:syntaxin-7 n=1 Tax=Triplophysa dalaica TaxID=1582913 RepID=UPI0024DFBD07|nr:syntaxin-7 [Triplophysa dalaica]